VDQELSEVVQFVRDRSGANIVILEGGEQRVRDLQVNDILWRDALEFAVDLAGCVLDDGKSGVLTISRPKRVSFDLRDIDLNEVIMTIAAASGANIIIGPEVEGTVRVSIKDVPWRDALEEIVKARGYTVVEERRNILRVVDPLTLEHQKVTRSYQLRYLRPTGPRVPKIDTQFHTGAATPPQGEPGDHFTALEALRKALSENGELDFIVEQNVIIVRDTIQVHEALEEILRRLDVEPAQVFVDVKFVSTSSTDLLDLGVDYGDSGLTGSITGGQIPIDFPFTLGKGGFEDDLFADQSGPVPMPMIRSATAASSCPTPSSAHSPSPSSRLPCTCCSRMLLPRSSRRPSSSPWMGVRRRSLWARLCVMRRPSPSRARREACS
jgi:type II secretory pathway component HofQ